MNKVKVKVVNKSNNSLPKYETDGSVGLDIKAFICAKNSNIGTNNTIVIQPGNRALIPTGIYIQLPVNYEVQVRPRSGLAFKHGITVLNTPGSIDSDYIGEIGVILQNNGKFPFTVTTGDRIAQLVLKESPQLEWESVTNLQDTERGAGGFGHTGV